jgi:hypothetical protein
VQAAATVTDDASEALQLIAMGLLLALMLWLLRRLNRPPKDRRKELESELQEKVPWWRRRR